MNLDWISEHYKDLLLPIHIKEDSEYIDTIKKKYEDILLAFEGDEKTILLNFTNRIIESIYAYFKNDAVSSYEIIFSLMKELSEDPDASHCFSSFKDCSIPRNKKGNTQLFRAREGISYIEYHADKMGHVPFNQRSKCAANRYSIAGIPCLYLGNTSYVCWLEMGCPSDDKFCVSPYTIDGDLKFFNIAIPGHTLYSMLEEEEENRHLFMYMIKIYLLEIATSVHVKQNDRQFHSEYIVSQNIMKSCIKLNFNGIIYYSTHSSDNLMNLVCGYNIALYIDFKEEDDSSPIFESKTHHGDSVNYAMFKNTLPSFNNMQYDLAVHNTGDIANIGSFKNQIPYFETQFCKYDNFIFARWNEGPRDYAE